MDAEQITRIVRMAREATLAELRRSGPLSLVPALGPEDAELAGLALLDGEYCAMCLFDDPETGFDNEEAGFA